MGMLDVMLNLISSQTNKIARVIGKNPQEIKSALEQGKKILPQILNDPTPEGGAKILKDMNIDKSFIDSAFNKYGNYASKIGLNSNSVKGMINRLESVMDSSKQNNQSQNRKSNGFNNAKYPKV